MTDFKAIVLILLRILPQAVFGGQWHSAVYKARNKLFIEQRYDGSLVGAPNVGTFGAQGAEREMHSRRTRGGW